MRRVLLVLVMLAMMSAVRRAAACAPWDAPPNLRSAATRAGLVVAAHRTDATLTLADGRLAEAFAAFEVEAVLKGRPLGRRIAVATRWLRDAGVEVSPGRSALLFLEKSGDHYYPVRDGCPVRTLPVADGKVLLGEIGVPFDVFAKELGFAWAEPPESSRPPRAPPLLLFAIACAGAGFAFGHRMAAPGLRQPGLRRRRVRRVPLGRRLLRAAHLPLVRAVRNEHLTPSDEALEGPLAGRVLPYETS